MLLVIFGTILVLILALLGVAASKPGTFHVERSLNIGAAPEKIFPHIDHFHEWASWSPWEGIDPQMKRTFSGATRGKGAVYAWNGNQKVGEGRMEVIDATPPSRIEIKLDFPRPLEGHDVAEFTLQPQKDSTTVVWAMYGPSAFMLKFFRVFVDMDRMIGTEFEKRLGHLKAVVEK